MECKDEMLVFYQNLEIYLVIIFHHVFTSGHSIHYQVVCRMNTFKYINKKHGQNIMKIVRTYESLKTKLMKIAADIRFIK